jgi:glycerol-3-phosphate acyltransferase PlsX
MARIVVDAMGSDDSPPRMWSGSVLAAREYGVEIILVGDESKIKPVLDAQNPGNLPIRIVARARDVDHGRQGRRR